MDEYSLVHDNPQLRLLLRKELPFVFVVRGEHLREVAIMRHQIDDRWLVYAVGCKWEFSTGRTWEPFTVPL